MESLCKAMRLRERDFLGVVVIIVMSPSSPSDTDQFASTPGPTFRPVGQKGKRLEREWVRACKERESIVSLRSGYVHLH